MTENPNKRVEVPIEGMDCADCVRHVQTALRGVPGVADADVYLTSEKAILYLEDPQIDWDLIHKAVKNAGYSIPEKNQETSNRPDITDLSRRVGVVTAVVFVSVLAVVILGEWLGLFDLLTEKIPLVMGIGLVIAFGYPVFSNVLRATFHRQIIAHSLMTLGVIGALVIGEWVTALLVTFFMRLGDYIERFTANQARQAVKQLSEMAPQTAVILKENQELEVPISTVKPDDIVIIRPGSKVPVDGIVLSGLATIDQAAITGESMPADVGPRSQVYAATLLMLGSIKVRTTHVGQDSTFGRIVKMVEEAEGNRADVQRFADKFSAYFLPVVLSLAVLTFLINRDPLASVAVLVVACSCAIALATPVAMIAAIGNGAKKGLLIKGGKFIELLDQANILLIDKTGTLTLGQPQVTDLFPLNGFNELSLLRLAASAERYSEHPIAEAVRRAARERGLQLDDPSQFEMIQGMGIRAEVNGDIISVGNKRLISVAGAFLDAKLEEEGKTLISVEQNGVLVGTLAVRDRLRPEVPLALEQLRELGLNRMELLTGDNPNSAASVAQPLGLDYQANLLPLDKISIVDAYQQAGYRVVMIGDGINDAPALAKADVGVAMGAVGTDVAIEAAHVTLMRDDWTQVVDLFRLSQRTMKVVRLNLSFTAVYNIIGLTLAALGILPPVLAAAAQSFPDLVIIANSSRLLRD